MPRTSSITGDKAGMVKSKNGTLRPLPTLPPKGSELVVEEDECYAFYTKFVEPAGGIQNADIKRNRKLGSGQFGVVYSGTLRQASGQIECAIKELVDRDAEHMEEFQKEAELMMEAHSPNVVSCFGVTQDDPICIIQELMPLGDLYTYLRSQGARNSSITVGERYYMSYQIANGMNHLAQHGIVHRDLAARNCMLGHPTPKTFGLPVVKITDFGLSRAMAEDTNYYRMNTQGKVPIPWMAPESLKELKFTEASDVWSFGVTMWEIFSDAATKPYVDVASNPFAILQFIDSGSRLPQPSICPNEAYEVMKTTWAPQTEDRPNFYQLSAGVAHCFIPHCGLPVKVIEEDKFATIVERGAPSGSDYYDNTLVSGKMDYYDYSDFSAYETLRDNNPSPLNLADTAAIKRPAAVAAPLLGGREALAEHTDNTDNSNGGGNSVTPLEFEGYSSGKKGQQRKWKGKSRRFWCIVIAAIALLICAIVGTSVGVVLSQGDSSASTSCSDSNDCSANATCTVDSTSSQGYTCSCNSPYEGDGVTCAIPTPGASPSPTPSLAASVSPSLTPSPSISPLAGSSLSPTPTMSANPSASPSSVTPSASPSSASIPSPSASISVSSIPSVSPTASTIPNVSFTPTVSPQVTPSVSRTPSTSAVPIATPSPEPTESASAAPSASPEESVSPSASAEPIPSQSRSTTGSPTASPIASPTASAAASPTASATASPTASATASPTASLSVSAEPSPEASLSMSAEPSPEASLSRSAEPSPEASLSRSAEPSPEASLSKSAEPSPEASLSKSAEPSPEASLSRSSEPAPSSSNSAASSPLQSDDTSEPTPESRRSTSPANSPLPPSDSSEPSPEPIESNSPIPEPSSSSSSSPEPELDPEPEPSQSREPEASPSAEPSPSREAQPSPSAEPAEPAEPNDSNENDTDEEDEEVVSA
eukprot:CFRG7431T1